MKNNHLGQQITDTGHVLTEHEKIAEDIRQLLVDRNPDGLMELGDDDVQALANFIVSYGSDHFYRGCRTHPEAASLLDRFKQAAEAGLPEKQAVTSAWNRTAGFNEGIEASTAALRSVSMEDISHE